MWIEILKLILFCHPSTFSFYMMLTTEAPSFSDQFLFPQSPAALEEIDRSRNAIWLEHRWLQDGVGDDEIVALSQILKQNGIRYVYPHLTPADSSGQLPEFSQKAALRFVRILKHQTPDVQILLWVGGVQRGYRGTRGGTIDLDSPQYQEAFASACLKWVNLLHVDGIHLNVEPVSSGDPRFVSWLHSLKHDFSGKILSVAAAKPAVFEELNPFPLHAWDLNYFEAVGKECDQLVIMNYDTSIPSPLVYSLFTEAKVSALLKRFAASGLGCRVLLGIPTYDDAPSHSSAAENIPAAMRGLRAALSAGNTRNYEGVALYAFWTTSGAEWMQFSNTWLHPAQESRSHDPGGTGLSARQ